MPAEYAQPVADIAASNPGMYEDIGRTLYESRHDIAMITATITVSCAGIRSYLNGD